MVSLFHPRRQRRSAFAAFGVAMLLLLGAVAPAFAQSDATPTAPAKAVGTVYALTNNFTKNEVLAYNRAEDGSLSPSGRFDTGGLGSGSYEASTNMLIVGSVKGESSPVDLGGGNDLLFAANAGSDSISVFQASNDGLKLIDVQDSGGERPTSMTLKNGVLYVLNSGGTLTGAGLCLAGEPSITGFTVHADGKLDVIPNSTQKLSGGAASGCAEITFNPKGDVLLVSQWVADKIDTFTVGKDGVASKAIANETSGFGPFSLAFDAKGHLLTSVNDKQIEGKAGVASYDIGSDGTLTPIGDTVMYGETDPCWMVVSPDGKYAWVTAFGPSPIVKVDDEASRRGVVSSFSIGGDGVLAPLDPQAANIGIGASDIALAGNGHFLYAINSFAGTISGFSVGDNGSLTLVAAVAGLPINPFAPLSSGLATRENS